MLIKFSKQITTTFAILMATKANLKLSEMAETELFLQVVTGFRRKLRIFPNV